MLLIMLLKVLGSKKAPSDYAVPEGQRGALHEKD